MVKADVLRLKVLCYHRTSKDLLPGGWPMLANGDKIEELLEDYPSLKQDDIYACLDYAASLAEEQITPIEHVV